MSLTKTEKEEFLNTVTHGLGLLIFLSFCPLMLAATTKYGSFAMGFGASVYCFGLLFTYSASTVYHATIKPKLKYYLRVLDHVAIFFLIAGTYTPFIIRYIGLVSGYKYLIAIWVLAFAGVIYKLFFTHGSRFISVLLYLALGWVAIFFYEPMASKMSATVLWLVIAGGGAFSAGSVFYIIKKIPYNHAIWHIFVLAGSVLHFIAVTYAIMYA